MYFFNCLNVYSLKIISFTKKNNYSEVTGNPKCLDAIFYLALPIPSGNRVR